MTKDKINVKFTSKLESSKILKEEDNFLSSLSNFDKSSRLQINRQISQEEFFSFISEQALDWEDHETSVIINLINDINSKFEEYQLRFPENLNLVKTTGKEESHAAYCRGKNNIIIPVQILSWEEQQLESLLIHEVFHIFSKNNPEIRKKLYQIIGFTQCPELDFPKELKELKITNPDAPINNNYITLSIDGKQVNLIPIIYASSPYDSNVGRTFFEYLQFELLEVVLGKDCANPVYNGGKLALHNSNELPEYFEKIGMNTDYIIHPEETLADNFVLLFNNVMRVRTPHIIEKIRDLLHD